MLKNTGKATYLIHMKDSRFDILSLSCAICIFHWEEKFLDNYNYMANQSACLVCNGMQRWYVKVVKCVCAALRVHLVILFHFKTKVKPNHSVLRNFFTELYKNLELAAINEVFFHFPTPAISAVSQKIFDGLKFQCSTDALAVVTKCTTCILRSVYFYESGAHEPQFPVFEQAVHVNKGITRNLKVE